MNKFLGKFFSVYLGTAFGTMMLYATDMTMFAFMWMFVGLLGCGYMLTEKI